MGQTSNTYGGELEVRPLAGWSETFWQHLEPYKQAIVEHPLFCGMSDGSLPAGTYRQALRAFYPLVENFPKYMALNLAKVRLHLPGHELARNAERQVTFQATTGVGSVDRLLHEGQEAVHYYEQLLAQ